MISQPVEHHLIDLSFLYFVLFSFVLIALILFILYFGVAAYFFFKASNAVSDGKK